MTVKAAGQPLSFSEIADEFGYSPGKNLGAYRVTQTYANLTLSGVDTGVPGSGPIKFSDLYSKKLNVIVDYFNGGDQVDANARNRYNNSTYCYSHGGWKTPPQNTTNLKVHVVINKKMGVSSNSTRTNVALRSGAWDSGTNITFYSYSNSTIYGAGGDGGSGALSCQGGFYKNDARVDGEPGTPGTNAIGFDFGPTTFYNYGHIQRGFGGGNGGYSSYSDCDKGPGDPCNGGGGGGGGAGWYNGRGGPKGPGNNAGCPGDAGSNSTDTAGGAGGGGKNCGRCSSARGGSGNPGRSNTSSPAGGNDGNCAIAYAPGVYVSYYDNGTTIGGAATGQTITTNNA